MTDTIHRACEPEFEGDQLKHVLVNIRNQDLVRMRGFPQYVQMVITLQSAVELKACLEAFLLEHGMEYAR